MTIIFHKVVDKQKHGLGAVDLFFLCAQSLPDESVANYEAAVLRPYHAELIAALGGQEDAYPYEEVCREFKLAALNFMRWLAGARLVGCQQNT